MAWRTQIQVSIGVGMLLGWGVAQDGPPAAFSTPKYVVLQTKAQNETGGKQAEALGELALFEFDDAKAAYGANRMEEWPLALQRAHEHAEKAWTVLQAVAAAGKTDGMKNTEVAIEKVTYGLQDLARDAHARDRAEVQAEADYFAQLRGQMLELEFAPKRKHEVRA